ncbi:MAG: hypothetical protein R3E04_05865 [Sphingobium sp.]
MKTTNIVYGLLAIALVISGSFSSAINAKPVYYDSVLHGKKKVSQAVVQDGKIHVAAGDVEYSLKRVIEIIYNPNTSSVLANYWGGGLTKADKSPNLTVHLNGTSFNIPFKAYRSYLATFESKDARLISMIKNASTSVSNVQISVSKAGASNALFSISFAVGKAQASSGSKAAPASASSQKSSKPASYSLPGSLTSLKPIAFAPGQQSKQTAIYLKSNKSVYMDASCQSAAFPYLRTKQYWDDVDSELEIVNNSVGSLSKLTRGSAASTCANPAARSKYRSQIAAYPQRNFDRMCTLLNAPASYSPTNIKGGDQTICINTTYIEEEEYKACRSSHNKDQASGKMSASQADKLCQCSGARKASYFAAGNLEISSKNLVKTGTMARTYCEGGTVDKAVENKWLSGSSQSTQSSSGSVPSKKTVTDEANDAVDAAKKKMKKKLEGIFGGF